MAVNPLRLAVQPAGPKFERAAPRSDSRFRCPTPPGADRAINRAINRAIITSAGFAERVDALFAAVPEEVRAEIEMAARHENG